MVEHWKPPRSMGYRQLQGSCPRHCWSHPSKSRWNFWGLRPEAIRTGSGDAPIALFANWLPNWINCAPTKSQADNANFGLQRFVTEQFCGAPVLELPKLSIAEHIVPVPHSQHRVRPYVFATKEVRENTCQKKKSNLKLAVDAFRKSKRNIHCAHPSYTGQSCSVSQNS